MACWFLLFVVVVDVVSNSSETPWIVAHQAPLSLGFPKQEDWSWVAISFSRVSSWPRDQTCVSCISRQILYQGVGQPSKWVLSLFQSLPQLLSLWKAASLASSSKVLLILLLGDAVSPENCLKNSASHGNVITSGFTIHSWGVIQAHS